MILLRQMREGGDDEDFRAPSWAGEIQGTLTTFASGMW